MREDYSADGEAWAFFPHDHARSRAYRWNEDGLGGICDDGQLLCLAFAFWNGRDPILKERIFGLTGHEGNHGEDAKEYWWYLDSTPTHSWMRWRYVYPQADFPYEDAAARSTGPRDRSEPEYELLDTGVFDEDRYWDVDGRLREGRGPTICACACASATPGPTRRRCTCFPRCGSATVGRGIRRRPRPEIRESAGALVAQDAVHRDA